MHSSSRSAGKSLRLLLPFAFLFSLMFGCSMESGNQTELIKAVNESLISSNITITKSTESILAVANDRLADPTTSYKAKIWQPKAVYIRKLSSDIVGFIEEIKFNLKAQAESNSQNDEDIFRRENKSIVKKFFITQGKEKLLCDELGKYKKALLAVDPNITATFKNLINIGILLDSVNTQSCNNANSFFSNKSLISAMVVLSQHQNNIRNIEHRMIQFCLNKIPSSEGFYEFYSVIVAQSSNYLKSGEEMEITAGVGAFSKVAIPVITAAGKNVELQPTGEAIYKFKTPKRPGKYEVPVKIAFTDQEGKRQTIEKVVEYTVIK